MKQQQNDEQPFSDSRKRFKTAFQEEEELSRAFEINNFYSNEQLNISQLKIMIERVKKNHIKTLPLHNKHTIQSLAESNDKNTDKQQFVINSAKVQRPKESEVQTKERKFYRRQNESDKDSQDESILQGVTYKKKDSKISHQLNSEHTEERDEQTKLILNNKKFALSKNGTADDLTLKKKNFIINKYLMKPKPLIRIQNKHPQISNANSTHYNRSRHLKSQIKDQRLQNSSLNKGWDEFGVQKKLSINNQQQLDQYESRIEILWSHYQLLSQILEIIHGNINHQKRKIAKYVEDVCSDMLEFIREVLESLFVVVYTKKQGMFLQRLRKNILIARLNENLALIFLTLQICSGRKAVSSYLINFIGYSSSNIIFTMRLLSLIYKVEAQLHLKESTESIFKVIEMFEYNSYGAVVTRVGQIIMRVEQNNKVIGIVLSKLSAQFDKTFQSTINKFAKTLQLNKPLFSYSKYIFQFLAFELAKNDIVGVFGQVEIAPSPYLQLQKQKTIIIEPWQVLFFIKNGKILLRPYTDTFLMEIGKHCNIVYWTDQMPYQIDPFLQKIQSGHILYRYYCKHQNGNYIKMLDRLGSDIDNTIIIDKTAINYHYNRANGIELPWRGQLRDKKLLDLICLLKNVLENEKPMVNFISEVRYQMSYAAFNSKSKFLKQIPQKIQINLEELNDGSAYPRTISKQSNHK